MEFFIQAMVSHRHWNWATSMRWNSGTSGLMREKSGILLSAIIRVIYLASIESIASHRTQPKCTTADFKAIATKKKYLKYLETALEMRWNESFIVLVSEEMAIKGVVRRISFSAVSISLQYWANNGNSRRLIGGIKSCDKHRGQQN